MRAIAAVVIAVFAVCSVAEYSSYTPEPHYESSPVHPTPSGTCGVWDVQCMALGAKCTADFVNDADKCKANKAECCQFPLYCHAGKCVEDNDKEACKRDDDCLVNYYGTGLHACVDGKCTFLGAANDACVNNSHCAGGMLCVDHKCKGLENATCVVPSAHGIHGAHWGVSGHTCAAGLVCSELTKTCVKARKAKEACGDGCEIGTVCNKGVCEEAFSLADGAECSHEWACGTKSVCSNGKCVAASAQTTQSCNEDSECKEGTNGKCEGCNHFSGKKFCGAPALSSDCRAEWAKATKCWAAKSCAPVPSSSLDTCVQEECPVDTNNVLSCKSNCGVYRSSYGKCAASVMLRNCPAISTVVRIAIAFGILVAIIALVFIIYVVARKMRRGSYTEVSQ